MVRKWKAEMRLLYQCKETQIMLRQVVQWVVTGITFWTLYRQNVDIECIDYIIDIIQ